MGKSLITHYAQTFLVTVQRDQSPYDTEIKINLFGKQLAPINTTCVAMCLNTSDTHIDSLYHWSS